MTFEFQCAHCEALITADRDQRGETSSCPECGEAIIIPLCDLRLGEEYAGFLLQKRLGSGTFGEVFMALHLDSGEIMALKVMPDGGAADKEKAQDRFLNEVAMMARVTHPHVVPATRAGMYDGYFFLAMEYIDGINLEERVETDGAMAEGEVFTLVLRVIEALDYAWESHKIIHRDIKPANIMVTDEGDVKLMDLGLSRSIYDSEDAIRSDNALIGTPYYMSPEQVQDQNIDWRSDQYSLGATIFNLLTGRPPFEAETCAELMDVILKNDTPYASQYQPDISPGVDKLLRYMMNKDPEDRYDSWGQVSQAVKRVLNGTLPQAPEKLAHMATSDGIRRSRMRNAGRSKLGSSTVSGIPSDTFSESSPHGNGGEATETDATATRSKTKTEPQVTDPQLKTDVMEAIDVSKPAMPPPGRERLSTKQAWMIAAIAGLFLLIVVCIFLIAIL